MVSGPGCNDARVDSPLLVVVTGMPAAGKTTVAEGLAHELRLPLIAKDGIKERLYDTLGTGDAEWSGRLGDATYALLFEVARALLAGGAPLVLEANFFRGSEDEFRRLPAHRLVQVHCDAPLELIEERYANRDRHPGHHDGEKAGLLAGRYESGVHGPLDLPGEVVELDTSARVDVEALAARLRPLL
jgi:predicted kinase